MQRYHPRGCRKPLGAHLRYVLRDRQGYAATLHQVWQQCRQLDLPLPSARPVAVSSICDARAKVRDQAFGDIHRAILARAPTISAGCGAATAPSPSTARS